jgi:hypothetical protein
LVGASGAVSRAVSEAESRAIEQAMALEGLVLEEGEGPGEPEDDRPLN